MSALKLKRKKKERRKKKTETRYKSGTRKGESLNIKQQLWKEENEKLISPYLTPLHYFFSYFNAKESTFIAANFAEGPCGFLVFLFTVFELVYFFVWFDLTHLLVQLQLSLVKGQN